MPKPLFSHIRLLSAGRSTVLATLTTLAACGGGSGDTSSSPTTVDAEKLQQTTVSGFPHAVDIYKPVGATRAIVALHGGGGNKTAIAYQLGLNSTADSASNTTINWAWLQAHHVMLVLPQGQHIDGQEGATTWTNYAMRSGQDDKAFLQALAAQIRSDYGIDTITLMGHSMGGVMTNRMWCESPSTFSSYVSLAGPASTTFNRPATPCQPGSAAKPYMGIIGDSDEVMQTTGAWAAPSWTINPAVVLASLPAWDNNTVIAEMLQQQTRTTLLCGQTLDTNTYSTSGNIDSWTSCGGRLVLKRVHSAEHGVASINTQMNSSNPTQVMDTVANFVEGL